MAREEAISAMREEIERLKKYYAECGYPGMGKYEQGNKDGRLDVLDYFLSFLGTLSEKLDKSLDVAAGEIYPEISTIDMPNDEDRFTVNFINKEKREAFKAGAEWREAQLPKLPDDLNEAAEAWEISSPCAGTIMDIRKEAFKAGAEWAFGQGVATNGKIRTIAGRKWVELTDAKDAVMGKYLTPFSVNEEVIVQVRKK